MYSFESRVRYSEADVDGYLKLDSLMDYFQDCSTFQSEDLGIGVEYVKKTHMGWMVIFWQIDVKRLPKLGDRFRVGTLPYQMKSFMGLRNFVLETLDGERLVTANSIWTLMDLDKMFPVKVPAEITEKYPIESKLEMEYTPRKITLPEGECRVLDTVRVGEYMLDSNNHVNNVQYVRMAIDQLSEKFRAGRFRIEYRKQAHLGDNITPVLYQNDEDAHRMTICLNAEDGAPYCLIEVHSEI